MDRLSVEDAEILMHYPTSNNWRREDICSMSLAARIRFLCSQLLDTMRENERLTGIEDRLITYGCHNPEMRYQVTKILGYPYKDSDNG